MNSKNRDLSSSGRSHRDICLYVQEACKLLASLQAGGHNFHFWYNIILECYCRDCRDWPYVCVAPCVCLCAVAIVNLDAGKIIWGTTYSTYSLENMVVQH